uniref:tumor necrosis factor receptor superfamily member 8 n=1 Tax=Ictidomys tridecemlineatus TaxID=43179 RepID=UPI001A9D4C6C|nr:tumor necrosis factor receptor superfamily member 8 [Ictidomys tridecemlineatus]
MLALRAALGLWLVGTLGAFPQDRPLKADCAGDPNRYYNEAAGACCYRCPPGQSPEKPQPCPQGPSDCGKRCEPDYYLSTSGRCTACVSCLGDLVEKAPCSGTSPRVCQCRPGSFCSTSATNSCARCSLHTVCPVGQVVQSPGIDQTPGLTRRCSSGPRRSPSAFSSHLSVPLYAAPGLLAVPGGEGPSPWQPCPRGSANCRKQCEPDYYLDRTGRCMACVSCLQEDLVEKAPCSWNSSRVCECRPGLFCAVPVANSCARCIPRPVCPPGMVVQPQVKAPAQSWAKNKGHLCFSGPMLFWVIMVLVLVVGSTFFLLCHQRACRRRFRQKLHLCHPAQPFPPKLEPVDSRPRRNLAQPRSALETEPSTEEKSSVSPAAAGTCVSVGAACPESLPLLDSSPGGGPPSPRDPPEPRVSTEHTNNKIEKIYIMKADTVIVGTVKTEASEGRGPVGPVGPEAEPEPELEVDHVPHYPEQETEPPLGSCGDVMFSVEEEGKEDLGPTVASGK